MPEIKGQSSRKDLSFLPEDYLEKRAQRRTNVLSVILFLIVMGGVIAAYYVTNEKRSNVQKLQTHVNEQFRKAAEQLAKLKELQAKKDHMIRKAKVTSVLVERVPRSILLSEMINKMPTNLSLIEMDLESKAVRKPMARTALEAAKNKKKQQGDPNLVDMPEVPEMAVTIRLTGVAPTDLEVSEFMTALKMTELFDSVNLVTSEQTIIEDEKMRRFRLEVTVNQDVNLHDYEPTLVRRDLKFNPMGEEVRIGPGGVPVGVTSVSDTDKPSFRD